MSLITKAPLEYAVHNARPYIHDPFDAPEALRWLMDGINRLPEARDEGFLDTALQQPQSFDDTRWDTLLAASVRHRLNTMGEQPPQWTRVAPLEKFWWPIRISPSQEMNAWAHTPAELLAVGIRLDKRAFDTA